VLTLLFQLTKISTKMDEWLNLNPKKRPHSNSEGTLLQGETTTKEKNNVNNEANSFGQSNKDSKQKSTQPKVDCMTKNICHLDSHFQVIKINLFLNASFALKYFQITP